MNILILGEIGVGKSIWINGLVNYLNYENLEDTEESDLITLVPTIFPITDRIYNTIDVTTGSDDMEGPSCYTQLKARRTVCSHPSCVE